MLKEHICLVLVTNITHLQYGGVSGATMNQLID